MTEEALFEPFRDAATIRDGEMFFTPRCAFDFIAACSQNRFAIIGVEGFQLSDGETRPQLDMIQDFSSTQSATWQSYCAACNQAASSLLQRVYETPGLFLNFTVLSETEWKKAA